MNAHYTSFQSQISHAMFLSAAILLQSLSIDTMQAAQSDRTQIPAYPSVRECLKLIMEIPDWTKLRHNDEDGRREVISRLEPLAHFPSPILRLAISEYIEQGTRGERMDDRLDARILLINRYVLAVPEKVAGESDCFDSFSISMPGDKTMRYHAPMRITADGKIELHGYFLAYIGPRYEPLAEFDYFMKRFGRRRFDRPPAQRSVGPNAAQKQ